MTSPCVRAPFVSAFVVVGVPLLTFCIAAPGRLAAASELRVLLRDVQAGALTALLWLLGRRGQARAVVIAHRADVERTYGEGSQLRTLVELDPLRLHHLRRLGMLGAGLGVGAGVFLPVFQSSTYTYGEGFDAVGVFLFDVAVIGFFGRIVSERVAIRLFEASTALAGGGVWSSRLRSIPLLTLLGGTLGTIGSLVVLFAASAASGLETLALFGSDFGMSAMWFLRATAPAALALGSAIGALMGFGAGLAQSERP